jgi:GNAT superfamily N-acetyltransferase
MIPDITPAVSSEQLAAFHRNCRSYWLGYGYAQRVEDGLTLYSVGADHPQLNGVMWLGSGNIDAKIAEARRRLAGHPWLWWVGGDSDPATLAALAAAGGETVGVAPIMAIRTDAVRPLPRPADLHVDRLPEGAPLSSWVAAYAPAMGVREADIPLVVAAEEARQDAPGVLVRFEARIEGRIVGVSELLLADGVAGIYLVATDEAWRRRGVGAALTSAALACAREHGFPLATLQATPMGEPLYRSLGFVKVAEYQILALPPL